MAAARHHAKQPLRKILQRQAQNTCAHQLLEQVEGFVATQFLLSNKGRNG